MSRASRVPRDDNMAPEVRTFLDGLSRASDYVSRDGTADYPILKEGGKRVFVQEGNATKGLQHTPVDHGTVTGGTLTISPLDGFFHAVTNNGAFTLNASTSYYGTAVLHVTNGSGAGAITFGSNFQKKYPSPSLDAVNGNKFVVTIYFFGANKADYSVQPRQ